MSGATADGEKPPVGREAFGDDRALAELMRRAQDGDAKSYRTLLAAVERVLRGWFARRLPPASVDDAVQDVMLAMHEKRHTFDPGRPFRPWLLAIARYKWIDRLRALASHPADALSDDLPTGDHADAVVSAVALERLLGRLKPAQADVIRLVKLQGLSIAEASARTGQSSALVKVNIHRGLGLLATAARTAPIDE